MYTNNLLILVFGISVRNVYFLSIIKKTKHMNNLNILICSLSGLDCVAHSVFHWTTLGSSGVLVRARIDIQLWFTSQPELLSERLSLKTNQHFREFSSAQV